MIDKLNRLVEAFNFEKKPILFSLALQVILITSSWKFFRRISLKLVQELMNASDITNKIYFALNSHNRCIENYASSRTLYHSIRLRNILTCRENLIDDK